jgi:hypothetical protein
MLGWTTLHNEELHNLYNSPNIIRIIKSRRMRWEGRVARMGEKRNAHRLLGGKPEEYSPLAMPRRTWVARWTQKSKVDRRMDLTRAVSWTKT